RTIGLRPEPASAPGHWVPDPASHLATKSSSRWINATAPRARGAYRCPVAALAMGLLARLHLKKRPRAAEGFARDGVARERSARDVSAREDSARASSARPGSARAGSAPDGHAGSIWRRKLLAALAAARAADRIH